MIKQPTKKSDLSYLDHFARHKTTTEKLKKKWAENEVLMVREVEEDLLFKNWPSDWKRKYRKVTRNHVTGELRFTPYNFEDKSR